ncbi:MAG TPA: phosphate acyltransferase PlsX [Alphaproteobacteria bacterium]|nr:phosphate acyltransferase PlsX [Alphaproteobacteria bacterium]USO06068.1 MAG: phosphate acyltransferase PlsX [Rhodospirillales bacterium]HOO82689.1 phosphate acyltransferase PlsX [Alphaproteobacteria bacterium]
MSRSRIIALDAMGGDYGPESVIPGAVLTLKAHPQLGFILFGDEGQIGPLLDRESALKAVSTVVHTEHKILSNEKPSAVLRKSKGSSMRLAIEAVKEGRATAVVSAGNTGALMALAKMVLTPLPGIHRPAIASIFPTRQSDTIMLDLGANVLVDAENLVQFAVLGAVFAKLHKNVAQPSVGLLNVGSEEMKGPDHVREAAAILSEVEFPGHYYGFVEGDDITKGTVDVVVSDGYAGNVALKTAEGVGSLTTHLFKKNVMRDPLGILGSMVAYFALKRFQHQVDPRRYNGGVFLGLNGLCVKSHGGCDALAFSSAVKLAAELAEQGYVEMVGREIECLSEQNLLIE